MKKSTTIVELFGVSTSAKNAVWSNESRVLDELRQFCEETNWLKLQGVL